MIAEEASEEWVGDHGHGASSVAKGVARQLGIRHLFCNPNRDESRAVGLKVGAQLVAQATAISSETGRNWNDIYDEGVRKQFAIREAFWLGRLGSHDPNNKSIIFVCGADHVDTFPAALNAKEILARIQCREWPEGIQHD